MLDVVRRLGNADASRCTLERFDTLYERSIKDSDGFWLEQAKRLDWFDEPSRAGEWSYAVSYTHLTLPTILRV